MEVAAGLDLLVWFLRFYQLFEFEGFFSRGLNLAQCCAFLAIIEVFDIFIYFFDKFFLVNRMKSFVFYIANCRNIFIDFAHNFSSDS